MTKIVIQYPFAAKEVLKHLVSSFPHHNMALDKVLIYNKLALEMVDSLILAVSKQSKSN